MSDKSPRQSMSKKSTTSLKQKRTDRKAKSADTGTAVEKPAQAKKR